MNKQYGRLGQYLICSDPECKTTRPTAEEEAKIKALEEKTKGEVCPLCGKPLAVKRGRFGYFLGCVDYPTCKGIMKIYNKTGFKCPKCLADPVRQAKPGDVVERKGRGRSKVFYGCSRYPDCDFITNKKPESDSDLQAALVAEKIK